MTRIDPSTVASWGSPEDRPERDRMRALVIGHAFNAVYREAEGGQKQHQDSGWCDWVRENTAIELGWMWSRDPEYVDRNADAYAQVAGDLILEETAKGALPSGRWFRTDICPQYGWLFEPACLRHDGWQLGDFRFRNGTTCKSWGRPSD